MGWLGVTIDKALRWKLALTAEFDPVPTHMLVRIGRTIALRKRWIQARRLAAAWLRDRSQFSGGKPRRLCPLCGHEGIMIGVGHPPRWDARCAQCGSRERHRLLWLWATGKGVNYF